MLDENEKKILKQKRKTDKGIQVQVKHDLGIGKNFSKSLTVHGLSHDEVFEKIKFLLLQLSQNSDSTEIIIHRRIVNNEGETQNG